MKDEYLILQGFYYVNGGANSVWKYSDGKLYMCFHKSSLVKIPKNTIKLTKKEIETLTFNELLKLR